MIVTRPTEPDGIAVYIEGMGMAGIVSVSPSPVENTVVVAWMIPPHLQPGRYRARIGAGEQSTSWFDFTVSTPDRLAERGLVSTIAASLPEAKRPGLQLMLDYTPLPAGIHIVDGLTEEHTYGPTSGNEWLVFGTNPDAGLAQDGAFWAIGNSVQGLTVVHNPIGPVKPIGWPEGRDSTGRFYAILDYSNPVNQNNQFFDAAGEGDDRKPLQPDPPPMPSSPAPAPAPVPPSNGFGLTGDLGPCPNGIRTVGIVIQLDDNTGFDWLLKETGEVLRELGAATVHDIKTEQMTRSGSHQFDAGQLYERIRSIANTLDCDCDEVVISIISHGKAKRDGTHMVLFQNRYPNRDADQPPNKVRKELLTADLLEIIARAFHDVGLDCVPVTTLLQPCYSGAVLDEAEDAVERGAGSNRSDFRVIAAAQADQPAYGKWGGENGEPEIYFLTALRQCSQQLVLDQNGDGRVNLQEAWPCLLEQVWINSMGGSGKQQNPRKWPN
jgi:hypothetical protein